jgi:ABC-type sugar transport system ATPase subunit
MSVKENTTLAVLRSLSRLVFTSSQSERSMTEELVRRLDIRAASISTQVANLSGGNQQKVVLGKFLAAKPKVLILDEPTRGVDVGAKREIHRIVCELAGQGLAILLISSELPEILGMSDRILVMKEGKIVAEMARVDATQEKILNLAM